MLNGAGFSAATTASYAACADVCPQERIGEGMVLCALSGGVDSLRSYAARQRRFGGIKPR